MKRGFDIWRDGKRISKRRALLSTVMVVNLVFSPAPFGVWWDDPDLLLLVIVEIAIYVLIARRVLRPTDPSELIDPPNDAAELTALAHVVTELAQTMRIHAPPIKININHFGIAPSIRVLGKCHWIRPRRSQIYLELPLGFLGFHRADPDAGRAVLAHELAHVRHEDWFVWAYASAAITYMKWWVLPWALFTAVLAFARLQDLDAAYLHQETEAAQMAPVRPGEFLIDALDPDHRPTERELLHEEMAKTRFEIIANSVVLMTLTLRLFWIAVLVRARRKSEYLADHIAAVTANIDGLLRALSRLDRPGLHAKWSSPLSLHPSSATRIAHLSKALRDPTVTARALPAAFGRTQSVGFGGPSFLEWMTPTSPTLRRARITVLWAALFAGPISGVFCAMALPGDDHDYLGSLMQALNLVFDPLWWEEFNFFTEVVLHRALLPSALMLALFMGQPRVTALGIALPIASFVTLEVLSLPLLLSNSDYGWLSRVVAVDVFHAASLLTLFSVLLRLHLRDCPAFFASSVVAAFLTFVLEITIDRSLGDELFVADTMTRYAIHGVFAGLFFLLATAATTNQIRSRAVI